MTVEQATALADWVASKKKNLTTIYITHGHGDHWSGVGTVLKRFPHARVVATPNTVQDAAYNDIPLYLVESNAQTRQEWIAALNTIESLMPRAVIASPKRPENNESPLIIEETRQYIRDFDRLAGTTKTAQELYDQMLALYPTRVNPGWALWSSARAAKP
jgi:ribonuclease BN (tRNA processing enzyme)